MPKTHLKKNIKPLSDDELEQIKVVFHQFETGVRSGTIRPGVVNIKYLSEIFSINLLRLQVSSELSPIIPSKNKYFLNYQSASKTLPNPLSP